MKTSPHQDAAGLAAQLHQRIHSDRTVSVGPGLYENIRDAANLIEQQAKALSEAEAERDDVRLQFAASMQEFDIRNVELAAAEARLAEAMRVIEPFAHPDLSRIATGNIYGDVSVVFARGDAELTIGDFKAARSFLNSASNKEPR